MLEEYLGSREKKAVDIMMVLSDEEEAMRTYAESKRYDEKIERDCQLAACIKVYFNLAILLQKVR